MSYRRITASPEEILRQASMVTADYFRAAIGTIDQEFGEGYAKKHPELIGALVQAASKDLHTTSLVQAIQHEMANLVSAVNNYTLS